MFFDALPNILYPDFTDTKNLKLAKNIFRRVRGRDSFNAIYMSSVDYVIQDGETPDRISFKQYNSTDWYWAILILNNILDVNSQWPLANDELESIILKKYGNLANSIRHWETVQILDSIGNVILPAGTVIEIYTDSPEQQESNYIPQKLNSETGQFEDWSYTYVDSYTQDYVTVNSDKIVPITNRDYEYQLNEMKRSIKLPRTEYLPLLEKEVRTLLKYETEYKITKEGYRLTEI